ncbi:helix-turn-helix transcriptional regulator [Streptomyces sp. Li-HN-5-11]|uniref:helix-turn-helix domain-containing protein n=1 Tax=Streptomyces sp. Li-HN-5-11 TaxID=3075432 RepID=UPI0028ACA443|nr:helix-turn-helix transcriptional regulator [Streptomyces sp. Li-HN-5-11]WNM36107.1 helix-turn-helix transcriptional regulator [Streptomyces sp. Li-HN-5-11]
MASLNVGNLGEYLREQRRNAQLSLRQLADAAGVSNPYLSQIERGLRKPSAEVLQQVAKALRISAETLYVRAGILDAERDRDEVETRAVILADPTLNERQKQVLLQIYESFRKENGFGSGHADGQAESEAESESEREAAVLPDAQPAKDDGDTGDRTDGTDGSSRAGGIRPAAFPETDGGGPAPARRRRTRTSAGGDADPRTTAS